MPSPATARPAHPAGSLSDFYARVRSESEALVVPLSAEDCQVQSMPDASPAKWHLAHVSWFFEQFVLTSDSGYSPFHGKFSYLFNSYYYSVGEMHLRPSRGLLTRPSLEEILAYRAHVDEAMRQLMAERTDDAGLAALVTLGLNHEQQHQELLLMDLKHLLSCNPLKPAYQTDSAAVAASGPATQFISHPGGVHEIGADGSTFCFDNETPRHRVWVDPFEMADRPVTNAEYRAFIEDGGYRDTELWLADGWATIQREGWERPLYWEPDLDREFTLHGIQPIDPAAPVCHLSYFEADAYARWAGRPAAQRSRMGDHVRRGPHHGGSRPAAVSATSRRILRRSLGMDRERLSALSRLSPPGRLAGRVQRQIHGQPDGASRRRLRHAHRPPPAELP